MPATSVSATLPLNPLGRIQNITRAVLRLRELEHDIVTLTIRGTTLDKIGTRTNDPIIVDMQGVGESAMQFIGYVHDVSDDLVREAATHDVTITGIGTSFRMRQAHQAVYTYQRPSDIARTIFNNYGLCADVEQTGPVLEVVTQAGLSDWALLRRLAHQYGALLAVNGVVGRFRPRLDGSDARHTISEVLNYRENRTGAQTQVWSFVPRLGDSPAHDGGAKAIRVLGSVDDRTLSPFYVTDDGVSDNAMRLDAPTPIFTQYDRSIVRNSAEGLTRASGAGAQGKYPHRATAEVEGRSRVRQGSSVYITGAQGGYDGFWDVIEVRHIFENKRRYRMMLELGTDSLGADVIGQPGAAIPLSLLGSKPKVPNARMTGVDNTPFLPGLIGTGGPTAVQWHADIASVS